MNNADVPDHIVDANTSESIIAAFYSSLIAEFSGTDDGHTPVLDERLIQHMDAYKDHYIKRLIK